MNICCFIDFFLPHYYGGGQIRLHEIAKRIVAQGHQVTVVTMRHPNVPDTESIDGVNIVHIGPSIRAPPKRTLVHFIHFFFAIRSWLKTHSYDIICAEGASLIAAQFFAKRTPIVATIHDVSTSAQDQWMGLAKLSHIAETLTLHLSYAVIITVSNEVRDILVNTHNISPNKVKVIYNGVDTATLEKILPKQVPKQTIVYVGRFIPHKHVDHLLRAFAQVLPEVPHAKLIIFGSGPEEEHLRMLAQELHFNTTVSFEIRAPREKVIGTLKNAACLVLPSTREGFGIVLAEAGALGIPVIAYDIPAVHEVIIPDKTGLIVPPTPDDLTKAILYLLKNPKKAKQLGTAAKMYITKTFSWDRSAAQTMKLFQELQQQTEPQPE